MKPIVFVAVLTGLLGAQIAPGVAGAEVLALAFDEAANRLVVRGLAEPGDTGVGIATCCAIVAGTATADTLNNRAWFVYRGAAGQLLGSLPYAGGTPTATPASGGYLITHVEHQAATGQLRAIARDAASGQWQLANLAVNGIVVPVGTLPGDCCSFRAGVSVLAGARLLLVGRRSADTQDHLLGIDLASGALALAVPIPANLAFNDLVAHPSTGVVYGLAHDTNSAATGLYTVDPLLGGVGAIGSGSAGCCYALAGPAVIDRTTNGLVALVSDFGSGTTAARSFDLATGLASNGPALAANALFEDFGIATGVLFADSFEN